MSDGYHIGLLVISALAYLAPEFIEEGRRCWLRSPLYIVKEGKKDSYYFTDEEYDKAKDKITGTVKRCKGLGTLEPEEARRSMFTEEFQRLDVMEWNREGMALLRELMGEDVQPRKDFIFSKIDFSQIRE